MLNKNLCPGKHFPLFLILTLFLLEGYAFVPYHLPSFLPSSRKNDEYATHCTNYSKLLSSKPYTPSQSSESSLASASLSDYCDTKPIPQIQQRRNDIHILESFLEQQLFPKNDGIRDEMKETIIQAVHVVTDVGMKGSNDNETTNNGNNFNQISEDQIEQGKIGYLIHKNNYHSTNQNKSHSDRGKVHVHIHKALINYRHGFDPSSISACDNCVDVFLAILHRLFRYHLLLKREGGNGREKENNEHDILYKFTVKLGDAEESIKDPQKQWNKELISSCPFLVQTDTLSKKGSQQGENNDDDCYEIDKVQFIQHLHEYSYHHRGTEQGRTALDLLGILSSERNTFDFTKVSKNGSSSNKIKNGRNVIFHEKEIIPPPVIDEINVIMNIIKSRGWLSTNPDSVDGLPSLHLNLISGGKPLFNVDDNDSYSHRDEKGEPSFDSVISYLSSLLKPYLYDQLLPTVRDLCGSTTVEISDVFLRNYGRNIQPDDYINDEDVHGNPDEIKDVSNMNGDDESVMNNSRFGLSPHYDVFTSATSVIALDSTASTGQNGLYTIHHRQRQDHEIFSQQIVSSHAALKEFFPLQTGDGVIHTFDILHGVDIDPNMDQSRTSLIIWFVDKFSEKQQHDDDEKITNKEECVLDQPWLSNPDVDDDVNQFILALASECKIGDNGNIDSSSFFSDSSSSSTSVDEIIADLYIQSSKHGNAFALNSLAEKCDDSLLSEEQFDNAKKALQLLYFGCGNTPNTSNNCENPFCSTEESINTQKHLARALWFESSMRGNRVAQTSLGDSLMEEYMIQRSSGIPYDDNEQEELLLHASTFFCMASQQGYDVAKDSLSRIVPIEYSRLVEVIAMRKQKQQEQEGKEEVSDDDIIIEEGIFMEQPVVQTALVSLGS